MIDKEPIKIAIASGKGGTGKTMLSTNLAAYSSRISPTLLTDLDVEEPDDFIFIKGEIIKIVDQFKMIPEWIENKCSICGICRNTCKYHAIIQLGNFITVFNELCHSCYACSELCPNQALPMLKHKMGETKILKNNMLTFIESRLKIGEEQAVPLIRLTHELVDTDFNNISLQIFDCPPGTSCPMVAATRNTDFVILVTEPTPFGLNDLALAVETVQYLSKPVGVVINRDGIGNKDVEKYCKQKNIPVIAKIPFSKQIAEYYSRGELVFDQIEIMKGVLEEILNHIKKVTPIYD